MFERLRAASAAKGVLCASILLLAPAVSQAAGIKIQNSNYDAEESVVIVKGKIDGFEGGTDVTARNLSTGAVLGSSFTDKQFVFEVPVASFEDVPCEVIVFAGEEFVTTEVRHGPGECTRYETTISGFVTDEPIPDATVTVTLDGVTYTTVADENGFYELDIISANLNQLVRIDAEGTSGSGEPIEFTSLTGTFSRVLDGESSGNVTNVTTASYILTVEANGGSEPTTAEELATAETSVDATELFQLAALIKLIVDSPQYAVPDGQSLIEFISDPAAVEAYTATVPQEDLDAALAEILADSNLVAGFTPEEIPERYYAIPTAAPGFIARRGDALEFDPAGTGAILGQDGINGQPIYQSFTWSIDAGRLVVLLDSPVVRTSFPNIEEIPATPDEFQTLVDNGIGQVELRRSITRYTYTRVTDGSLVDIAQRETREELYYPPIPLNDGSTLPLTNSQSVDIATEETNLRSSLDIEPVPFSEAASCGSQSVCAVGVWAGTFHYTESPGTGLGGYQYPATAYGDIVTLAAGGAASGTLGSPSATWSIDADGALTITYGDGWAQKMEIIDQLNGENGIFSVYTRGAERFASYDVYSRADSVPPLTGAEITSVTDSYFQGEVNSWIPGSFQADGSHIPLRRFGWQFDGDGNGRRFLGFNSQCGGPGVAIRPMTWELVADGSVEFTYPWFSDGAGNTYYRIRNWYRSAEGTIDGDRVFYVIEVDRAQWGELLFAPRLNIEREILFQGDYCEVVNETF